MGPECVPPRVGHGHGADDPRIHRPTERRQAAGCQSPGAQTAGKTPTPATASANREWPANLGGWGFSPDTRLFAAAYAGAVYFFDVETGKEIRKLPLKTGSGPFAISPDGKSLAAVATVAAGPPRQISLMLVHIASEKRPGNR